MNSMKKVILLAEVAIASRRVHLLPEPAGERFGTVIPANMRISGEEVNAMRNLESGFAQHVDEDNNNAEASHGVLRFVAVGDSLVAGSGVVSQSESLTPRICQKIADRTGIKVRWETHAKLGSTMRRVRYRFLEEFDSPVDILFVCAGSNDIMARRTRDEWVAELNAVLDIAQHKATHVVLCSSGQPHHSPKLPRMLRHELASRIDIQTEDSARICRERGVDYVDVAHAELFDGFWESDGFHPSAAGYEFAANQVVSSLSFLKAL